MPLSMMTPLTRPPSRDLDANTIGRSLSREEAYHLADTARRKSSNRVVCDDLRLKLSHVHLLDMLLQDLARTERELQTSPTEEKYLLPEERKRSKRTPHTTSSSSSSSSSPSPSRSPSPSAEVDEYGFPLEEEDSEEDLGGLALMRTESRRPMR
ncbi:hypothetical protein A1O1_03016 [Capronia coronata CBS 617.96]|uniref:Uncharacterized protein n=1 Tax=Capronia coronata CBS 617.96 TaxID=1182541 RepID=W9YY57_9EURO|nr:uncharacterized protein A1O1_03016 [Capronia coronata CBS 617.96]EXJ94620.1 hypothetical protein A1O1_03016 [Capronia coronata CBS 617.96]